MANLTRRQWLKVGLAVGGLWLLDAVWCTGSR